MKEEGGLVGEGDRFAPGRGDGSIHAVPPIGASVEDGFFAAGERGVGAGDCVIQLSRAAVGSGARVGEGAGCGTDIDGGFSATGDCEIQLSRGDGAGFGGAGVVDFGVKPGLGADLGTGGALDCWEIQLSVAEGCDQGTGGGGAGRGGGAGVPLSNQLPRLGCGWTGSDVCVWLPEAEGEWTDVLEAAPRAVGRGGCEAGCPPNQLSIADAPGRCGDGGGTGAEWAPDDERACRRGGSGAGWVGMTMVGSDHAVSLETGGVLGAAGGTWS